MWYVQDKCIGKEASAIGGGDSNVVLPRNSHKLVGTFTTRDCEVL